MLRPPRHTCTHPPPLTCPIHSPPQVTTQLVDKYSGEVMQDVSPPPQGGWRAGGGAAVSGSTGQLSRPADGGSTGAAAAARPAEVDTPPAMPAAHAGPKPAPSPVPGVQLYWPNPKAAGVPKSGSRFPKARLLLMLSVLRCTLRPEPWSSARLPDPLTPASNCTPPPCALQVYVTQEEVQAIKGVGQAGMTLLGFKQRRCGLPAWLAERMQAACRLGSRCLRLHSHASGAPANHACLPPLFPQPITCLPAARSRTTTRSATPPSSTPTTARSRAAPPPSSRCTRPCWRCVCRRGGGCIQDGVGCTGKGCGWGVARWCVCHPACLPAHTAVTTPAAVSRDNPGRRTPWRCAAWRPRAPASRAWWRCCHKRRRRPRTAGR